MHHQCPNPLRGWHPGLQRRLASPGCGHRWSLAPEAGDGPQLPWLSAADAC